MSGRATMREYGVRMADGRIEVVPGREFGRRLVENDPRRTLLSRTVSPWTEPNDTDEEDDDV